MRKILLLMLAVTSTCFSLPFSEFVREKQTILANKYHSFIDDIMAVASNYHAYSTSAIKPLDEIKEIEPPKV